MTNNRNFSFKGKIIIGNLNVANEIVDLNYQILRTQLALEKIVNNASNVSDTSQIDLQEIDNRALDTLQKKYPNMGITFEVLKND